MKTTKKLRYNRIWILFSLTALFLFPFNSEAQLNLDVNGKVGIASNAPIHPLTVVTNTSEQTMALIGRASDDYSVIAFFNNDGTTRNGYLIGGKAANGMILGTCIASPLRFWTNGAERMTILSGGDVGIGITHPGAKLDVQGAGTGTVTINTSGDVKAAGNTFYSDLRFKINIDSLQSALTIIRQLKPKSYYFDTLNYNGLNKFDFSSKKQYGFIAQNVETILPELVSIFTKDAILDTLGNIVSPAYKYRSLNYNAFISILTKGIQELQQKTDSLKTKTINQDSINKISTIKDSTTAATLQAMQNKINELDAIINSCCVIHTNKSMEEPSNSQSLINSTDVELSNKNIVVLTQNVPNPFSEQTLINYFLPDNITRAQIIFLDQSGKLIKAVDLTEKGKGILNVFANDLSSGIYTYSIIVDGQTMETKKMVKTK